MTKSIETRERFYRDEDGEITGRSVDEYIGELLITKTDFDNDGACKCRIDYAHDDRGNNILRLVRWGARQAALLVFHFDEQGRQTRCLEYDRSNNLVYTYVYEPLGGKKFMEKVYAADGALLHEKVMEQVGEAFVEADRVAAWRASEREAGQTEG
jgi:hypothetical protein